MSPYSAFLQIKPTGVILAHGSNASEWKGKLLNEIANMLAAEGNALKFLLCFFNPGKNFRPERLSYLLKQYTPDHPRQHSMRYLSMTETVLYINLISLWLVCDINYYAILTNEINAGYIVMRYCCRQKEQRRQRMFEKALDACATSPFARTISQWVLAGILISSLSCSCILSR